MWFILKIILIISFILTAVSYTILLYERLNSRYRIDPRKLLFSFLKELLAYIYLFFSWIFGFFPYENYIPRRLGGVKIPTFIIPGYFLNRASVFFLFYMLRNRGFENIYVINPSPFTGSIDDIASNCVRVIKEILESLAIESKDVFLVGHSLGGLVAKYIAENKETFGINVQGCVTICSGHYGTKIAVFGIGKNASEMIPNSEFVKKYQEVKEPSLYLCIGAEYDQLTIPYESSFIDGASRFELESAGHFSPLFSQSVADAIFEFLKMREKNILYEESFSSDYSESLTSQPNL
jgi:pimeloyl-ACP methyl ester carboxylesterase